ncbi:MAG: FG-GAP repeat protein, partial [Pseudomonadales bacterium]
MDVWQAFDDGEGGTNWEQINTLTGSDDSFANDGFGEQIVISSNNFFIGARNQAGDGRVFLFRRSGSFFSSADTFIAIDAFGVSSNAFGSALAFNSNRLLVGAESDEDTGAFSGAGYFFDLDIDLDGYLNSFDADRDGDGIPGPVEELVGLNGNNATDGSADLDNDTASNKLEYQRGSQINNNGSVPTTIDPHQKSFLPEKSFDGIGDVVAVSGSYAVIGNRRDNEAGEGAGAAWVYKKVDGEWQPMQKLLPDAGDYESFGWSVAIDGETIAVGAPQQSEVFEQGGVYLFGLSGGIWESLAWLSDELASDSAGQGASVALRNGTLVVGAPGAASSAASGSINRAGQVYVYTGSGDSWSQQAVLEAFGPGVSPQQFSGFAESVAFSGEYVVTGAQGNDALGSNAGQAYVFERTGTTWSTPTLLGSASLFLVAGDNFGSAVAADAQSIAIRSDRNEGTLYLFDKQGGGWSLTNTLQSPIPAFEGDFGVSLSMSYPDLLAGSDDSFSGLTGAGR